MKKPNHYVVKPAMFAPSILSLVSTILAVQCSWWWLAAVPSIWLGAFCAAPNLNLVNGCMAYVAIVAGMAISTIWRTQGTAIYAGAFFGLCLSALEKRLLMRPR